MLIRFTTSKLTGTFATVAVTGGLIFATAVPSQAAEVAESQLTGHTVQEIESAKTQALYSASVEAALTPDDLDGATLSAVTKQPVVETPAPAETTVRTAGGAATSSSSTSAASAGVARAQVVVGSSIVETASQFLGVPYSSTPSAPTSFDCSLLVQYVYGLHGISLPRTDAAQAAAGTIISQAEAQPGDLVWKPGHIGIYVGNGMMLHAPKPGDVVKIAPIYSSAFQFVRI